MAKKAKSGSTSSGAKGNERDAGITAAHSDSYRKNAKPTIIPGRTKGTALTDIDITVVLQNAINLAESRFGVIEHGNWDGHKVIVLPFSMDFCPICHNVRPEDDILEGRCSECRPSDVTATKTIAVTDKTVAVTHVETPA